LKPDDAGAGVGGEVYWTLFDPAKIQRADLDGTNVEDVVTLESNPISIALDPSAPVPAYRGWGTVLLRAALVATGAVG
jgi:hypothetical protein